MSEKLFGTPISGGDNLSYPKARAFDGNEATDWLSSQVGASVNGVAYIGLAFANSKKVRLIRVLRVGIAGNYDVSSIKVQKSNDGVSWEDVKQFDGIVTTSTGNDRWLELSGFEASGKYIVIRANSATGGSSWAFYEVEMYGGEPDAQRCSCVYAPVILSTMPAVLTRGFR